ncbi:G-type lectin S-receptor-like serine/threonine-protein kinase At4g27290 [Cornus florida]|uniref:G-type lectin S-receptor-like serine/threonine-protein kinase At4g27290 n=1 Tax=Cornus florida TaxID=4283 RepID=UPI002898BB4F|nr:G-type lectin S-receptor-like serine/threonine-protein kinase At4g27290 [Cornus florida]
MMVLPLIFLCFFLESSIAIDTISPNQTLSDNGQTLVSSGEKFELGFFSPWNSNSRYIGIWFYKVPQQTPVWVANKDTPIPDSSGVLTISATGNIIIFDNQTRVIIWTSNSSSPTMTNPVLQLLDTGNLVVVANGGNNYLWQSFDHPCDTLIPGMKLGWDLRTNQEWYLRSWNSLQDPSPGVYTYRLDYSGLPQLILRQNSVIVYRSGPWDGTRFGGGPPLGQNPVFTPIFVVNSSYVYYSFENNVDTMFSRFVANQSGTLEHLYFRRSEWVDAVKLIVDTCDDYAHCGPYGICNINDSPICHCADGFTPKFPNDWNRLDYTGGCVPRTPLNCSVPVGFRKFPGLKLPDSSSFNEKASSPEECQAACSSNCSCVAYAITEFSGCVVWLGGLLDIRQYSEGGQELYIRMAASDLGSHNKDKRTAVIASVSVISGVLLLCLITWYVIQKRARRRRVLTALSLRVDEASPHNNQSIGDEDLELPLFDLVTVSTATNSFSFTHKIGEGGFGPVYRGKLLTGQEIAVKRLSKDSRQGLKEFKNEVILIAKLQHRNLVRLLGCCIHEEERMLIYEYMPNRSLDLFIFSQTRGTSLDCQKRYEIIVGIARGLLYLHRDSRLRIIHRDLKASNILLDSEMNPKISDFGMARTFGGDQSEENTSRIMGTYGYMSPEYQIDGLFSVKSDVFSFGVLVLEIVSGKKNRGFFHADHDLNLLGHAWKLWNEENPMKLMDAFMEGPIIKSEVVKCIHVGLLCVQQRPEDRPTMSTVVLTLDSENPILPQPKQPGFYSERFPVDTESSSTGKKPYYHTSNEVTMSILHGR